MKLKNFLIKVDGLNPEMEIFCNSNQVSSVTIHEDKIICECENSLESYYNYHGKLQMLKDMITDLKKDGIVEISEIEAVQIAHNTELDCIDVVGELTKAHILISKED